MVCLLHLSSLTSFQNCWEVRMYLGHFLHWSSKLPGIFLTETKWQAHAQSCTEELSTPLTAVFLRILSFFEIQVRYFHVGIKSHSLRPKAPLSHLFESHMSYILQSSPEMCGKYFYTSWLKGETFQSFPNGIKGVCVSWVWGCWWWC